MRFHSAFFFLATSAIIWGATAPIMKLTLTQIPVFSLAFLRMFFASAILFFFVLGQLKIQKEDYKDLFLASLFAVTLNLGFFFAGLKLSEAILASFLTASIPIFTIIASHIFLKEKISRKLLVATILALVGVLIIIGKPNHAFTFKSFIGNLLLLASTISWVVYEIKAKRLLKKYSAKTITFYLMAIGTLTFLPFFIFETMQSPWYLQVTAQGFTGLLYGIFFSSLTAYLFWQKGLSLLPAGQAAFFFYLDPISGALLSIILLGEKLTPALIIGGVLIAVGVILAENNRKNHPLIQKMDVVHPKPDTMA